MTEKPQRSMPHWKWIWVERWDFWWWEDMVRPRRKIVRAGRVFREVV